MLKYFSTIFLSIFVIIGGVITAYAENSEKKSQASQKQSLFGKWALNCPKNQKCRVGQTIIHKQTEQTVVIARVFKDKTGVLVLSLPKGVFLAPGVSLRIDKGKLIRYPFETCDESGCHTGLKLSKKLLSSLKRGTQASIIFYDSRQKPVLANLSLEGFTKAYAALK